MYSIISKNSIEEEDDDDDDFVSLDEPSMQKSMQKSHANLNKSVHVSYDDPSNQNMLKNVTEIKSKAGLPIYTKSDSSVYPSYTNLILPYRVICRQRYQHAINMHHEQFIKEIRLHEKLQPYALGGCRLRREFCDPILRKVGFKDIITLTLDEERRLEHILKTDPKEL